MGDREFYLWSSGQDGHKKENNQFAQFPSWKSSVCPKCAFSVLEHFRKYAGCEPASWGLLAKTVFSHLKARMFHSQTHLGKHVGC